MKALFNGQECVVVDDTGDGVVLEPMDGDEDQRFYVDYGDNGLIIDPTDGELDAAEAWRKAMPTRSKPEGI